MSLGGCGHIGPGMGEGKKNKKVWGIFFIKKGGGEYGRPKKWGGDG